jgi:ribosome-binding protein aMBF1 (putative translation factor)
MKIEIQNKPLACEIKKQLGEKVREERERLGLSIADLYRITGWDYADISNFERNAVNQDMSLSKYVGIVGLVRAMELSRNKKDLQNAYKF